MEKIKVHKPKAYSLSRLLKLHKEYEKDNKIRSIRQSLKNGQHPHAVVVSCSDSRVPPEVVFRLGCTIGIIFVVRSAGHVLDKVGLESVAYAVETLRTRLVIVLGHEGCGAVQSACNCAVLKAPASCPYQTIMTSIISSFDVTVRDRLQKCATLRTQADGDLRTLATRCNVSFTIKAIKKHINRHDLAPLVVGFVHGENGELIGVD
jgi:carbonic anhydrase